LSDSASLNLKFDSLDYDVKIISSDDQKIRIFSFDERCDGNWPEMAVFVQYHTD